MSIASLPKTDSLNQQLLETVAQARNLSEQGKDQLAASAWAEVEQLRDRIAEKSQEMKTDFDRYCENNPWAVGCLIYDV